MRQLSVIIFALFLCTGIAWAGGGLDPTGKEERGATFESVLDLESIAPSDEGVIQIDIPGIGSRDFLSRFVGDTLFLPYMTFCDFLHIPITISPDYLELGGQLPIGQPFEISRLSSTARSGKNDTYLPPTAIRVAGGEVYVEQSFLLDLLDLKATYDTMELKLRLIPDEKIPALQQKRNNEKYAALAYEEEPAMAPPEAEVERHFLGNPVIDWTIGHQSGKSVQSSTAGFRIGTEFMFGTLELNTSFAAQNFDQKTVAGQLNNWSWRFFLPSFSPLRQIGLGNMAVGAKNYYAAEVSNLPLTPRSGFTIHDIRGQTQPGWTVELYDGPRLVDVTSADSAGRYEFRVPVGYGTVDRMLRFVGPYGEVLTEQRRIQLNPFMVPAGELEYSARFGVEKLDPRAPIGAEMRASYGLTDNISIGLEGSLFSSSLKTIGKDSINPTVVSNLWFGETGSLSLGLNPIKKVAHADFFSINADGWSWRITADSVALDGSRFVGQLGGSVPVGSMTPGLFVRASKDMFGYAIEAMPSLSAAIFGINFISSVKVELPHFQFGTNGSGRQPRPFNAVANLRAIMPLANGMIFNLESDYDWARRAMPRFDLSMYTRVFPFLGLSLGYTMNNIDVEKVTWQTVASGSVRIQFDVDLRQAKSMASAIEQGGEFSGWFLSQGSAMISPVGVVTTPTYAMGQAAVMVKAFRDVNQNGVRDAGEDFLESVTATLSQGRTSITTVDGSFTGLLANSQWVLEIDRWAFADEGLFPTRTRFSVFTTSSSLQVIEVACVEGFDVIGSCKIEEGTTSSGKKMDFGGLLNGLRVQLVSSITGAIFDGEVFSDGSIFIPGVCAGEYRVLFDQNQLASRRLSLLSTSDLVSLTAENHRIPTILLQRAFR